MVRLARGKFGSSLFPHGTRRIHPRHDNVNFPHPFETMRDDISISRDSTQRFEKGIIFFVRASQGMHDFLVEIFDLEARHLRCVKAGKRLNG